MSQLWPLRNLKHPCIRSTVCFVALLSGVLATGSDTEDHTSFYGYLFGHGPIEPLPVPYLTVPTPAPSMAPIDHVDVLQVATTMKLCDCPCGAFENDPGVIVNTDGRFKSSGERAVAFAVAASVHLGPHNNGVRPGKSLQSTSFVAVEWHEESSSHEKKSANGVHGTRKVCDTTIRVLVEVEPRNCGVDLSDGAPINLLNPNIYSLAQNIDQQLVNAANYGTLQMNLDAIGFEVDGGVCEAPHDMKMYTHVLDLKRRNKHMTEFDRCSTMLDRGGTRGLDQKCRRELTGLLLMVGFAVLLSGLCCLRILASCDCGDARTRRERIEDTKFFSIPRGERLGQGFA